MKKNLLITLADKNYINQAKQLFSSVYFNAGWKGDYMLLAHEIPEKGLKWFRNKGILIKECEPLYYGKMGGRPATVTSKFYLFTPEFKKWDNIIYLDADSIVRASLDKLTKIRGFWSVPDVANNDISTQIANSKMIESRSLNKESVERLMGIFKKDYDLKEKIFCTGIMAFGTDIIKEDIFSRLNDMVKKYGQISAYGDQLIFNLFFYKKWGKLPPVYNIYLENVENQWDLRPEKIKGIILHFIAADKPWITKNYFYKEWKDNLGRAEQIDLNKIKSAKKWSTLRIQIYSLYIKARYIYISYPLHISDKIIGLIGVLLKKRFPGLYFELKKIKNKLGPNEKKPTCNSSRQKLHKSS